MSTARKEMPVKPNPLAVGRNAEIRHRAEAAPLRLAHVTRTGTKGNLAAEIGVLVPSGLAVPVVGARTAGSEPADVAHYVQPSTGAYLTVGPIESTVEWEHDGHEAVLNTYALVEKPKRVMVECLNCGARWDEKR